MSRKKNSKRQRQEKMSRPPMERIERIRELLENNAYPNAVTIAREFGTTERTIKRDVWYMRKKLKEPIGFNRSKKGYFYTKPVKRRTAVALSERELFSFLVVEQMIAAYEGTPAAEPLRTMLAKVTSLLDTDTRYSIANLHDIVSIRAFAPEDMDSAAFELFSKAAQERRGVQAEYKKPQDKDYATRHVHPYHLMHFDGMWYVIAKDTKEGVVKTFMMGRFRNPELSNLRFVRPENFDVDAYLGGALGVMKGTGDYDVVVEFDAWSSDFIKRRKWHKSKELVELPSGAGSRLRLRLSGLQEVERLILSWGTHATVIKPQELRESLGKIGAELAKKYGVQ